MLSLTASQAQMQREAANKATCDAVLARPLQPEPALDPSFKADCDSTAFYFGLGRPVDYSAARRCALVERSVPRPSIGDMFYGPGILSMIYANGKGVKPDFTLATRFVCEDEWAAPAELQFRLELLERDKKTGQVHAFDLCDTSTSGLSEGFCASINARAADADREKTLKRLTAALDAQQSAAFHRLQVAEAAFEEARTRNEVDLSGTGRAAFSFEEQQKLRDSFVRTLRLVLSGTLQEKTGLASADRRLNATYRSLRAAKPDPDRWGTVTFEGIQTTQRAWLPVRDSWSAFAEALHGKTAPADIAAFITLQRNTQLAEFAGS